MDEIFLRMRQLGTVEERVLAGGKLFYGQSSSTSSASIELIIDSATTVTYLAIADVYSAEYSQSSDDQAEIVSILTAVIDGGVLEVRRGLTRWVVFGQSDHLLEGQGTFLRAWSAWTDSAARPKKVIERRIA